MKKSALIIGSFTKRDEPTGFTGKLDTLGTKAEVSFLPNEEKEKDNQPDFIVVSGGKEIGVAWERSDDRGHYVSVAFEEPSLAPGYYSLVKSGAEKSYQLLYRKLQVKKEAK